jgi:peptide chain release factor 1
MQYKEQPLRDEFAQLEARLSDPAIFSSREYPRLAKRRQELEKVIALFDAQAILAGQKTEAAEMVTGGDKEMVEMAREELQELDKQILANDATLREMLLPKDPNDDRDVVIEIRAAAGGDEASLFGADLYRMYVRWCERHNFKVELISEAPSVYTAYNVYQVPRAKAVSTLLLPP